MIQLRSKSYPILNYKSKHLNQLRSVINLMQNSSSTILSKLLNQLVRWRHLGKDDMHLKKARETLGDTKLIGVTIHSEDEISDNTYEFADYAGIGPFRNSKTKSELNPQLSKMIIPPSFIFLIPCQFF